HFARVASAGVIRSIRWTLCARDQCGKHGSRTQSHRPRLTRTMRDCFPWTHVLQRPRISPCLCPGACHRLCRASAACRRDCPESAVSSALDGYRPSEAPCLCPEELLLPVEFLSVRPCRH